MAAVGAVIVLRRDAARRAVAWWWLAWIALFFAPVVAYASFSDRFGYLAAAGLCALVATALARDLTAAAVARKTTAIMGALVLAVLWTRDLRAHGRDWLEGGLLATRVVDDFVRQEPTPDGPVALHVIDLPNRHRSALVWITYFPLAVQARYPVDARGRLTFDLL